MMDEHYHYIPAGAIAAVLGGILTVLFGITWFNPHANIPVVSEITCSVKGATWYDGDMFNEPGCYKYEATP